MDATELLWDTTDLPTYSTLLALKLHLVNPKLPVQDTSHYNKLSWRAKAGRNVFHVEYDRRYATGIKHLAQLTKESNLVTKMWGRRAYISKVMEKDSTPS
jgi:hypothetical protein